MTDARPTIRHARLSDRDALASLMRRSVNVLCARDYSEVQIAAVADALGFGAPEDQLIRDETYFVAEANGEILGCGGWSRRTKPYSVRHDRSARELVLPHPTPGRAAIRAVFVHPAMAGRGTGRLLVRAAESAARKWGHEVFEITATLTGVPLYQKLGYRLHGIYSFDLHGNGRFPFALMSKTDPYSETIHTSDACGGASSPATGAVLI